MPPQKPNIARIWPTSLSGRVIVTSKGQYVAVMMWPNPVRSESTINGSICIVVCSRRLGAEAGAASWTLPSTPQYRRDQQRTEEGRCQPQGQTLQPASHTPPLPMTGGRFPSPRPARETGRIEPVFAIQPATGRGNEYHGAGHPACAAAIFFSFSAYDRNEKRPGRRAPGRGKEVLGTCLTGARAGPLPRISS